MPYLMDGRQCYLDSNTHSRLAILVLEETVSLLDAEEACTAPICLSSGCL